MQHHDFLLTGKLYFPSKPTLVTSPSGKSMKAYFDDKECEVSYQLLCNGQNANNQLGHDADITIDEISLTPGHDPKILNYSVRGTFSNHIGIAAPSSVINGKKTYNVTATATSDIKIKHARSFFCPRQHTDEKTPAKSIFITTFGSYTDELYLGETSVHDHYIEAAKEAYDRLMINIQTDLSENPEEINPTTAQTQQEFYNALNEAQGRPFNVQASSNNGYQWSTEVQEINL